MKADWRSAVDSALLSREPERLAQLLLTGSRLPGPRGNLELASAFSNAVAAAPDLELVWSILLHWSRLSPQDTRYGAPAEYLPFCAAQALGALYLQVDDVKRATATQIWRAASADPRWRVREGVAMGLQRVGEGDFALMKELVKRLLTPPSSFRFRAVLAGLAHHPILTDRARVLYCLGMAGNALDWLLSNDEGTRDAEGDLALRKAMEYAPSVFVTHLPHEGFRMLEAWAGLPDPRAGRLVRVNASKSRLRSRYRAQVAQLLDIIGR